MKTEKLLRRSISEFRREVTQTVPRHHINHCLEALRQHVMCVASDLPIAATKGAMEGGHVGAKECRNWQKLEAWATDPERDACWKMIDEYKTTKHDIEKFAFCEQGSRYHSKMEKYFDENGHRSPWY